MRKITPRLVSENLKKISSLNLEDSIRPSFESDVGLAEVYNLSISKIEPYKRQARKIFDQEEISRLAATIKEHGIRQPITVLKTNVSGIFEVVSGERRLRAAKEAGLKKIPVIILSEEMSPEEIALVENVQRKDLHPIELGNALGALYSEMNYGDMGKLAEKLGMQISKVSEHISFSKIPESIKNKIIEKKITSRSILRRLVKAKSTKDAEIILEKKSGSSKQINFKYFKIDIIDGKQILKLSPEKINNEDKEVIIKNLEDIIKRLKS